MTRVTWCGCAAAAISMTIGTAWAGVPSKQSNAGDSISQGFSANDLPGDHPSESWVQGTDPAVDSLYSRYVAMNPAFEQEPESVTGAELVGGSDNFAAQASRICAQATRPEHVTVLLGGNDVCNRPASSSDDAAANLYSVETWTNALRAGLDQLDACLPDGAVVEVLSMPRVDFLYDAGTNKSWWCTYGIWPLAGICRIVTAEGDAGRRAQIGARVDDYNAATAGVVATYDAGGAHPRGLRYVTDWKGSIDEGFARTSVGTYAFGSDEINDVDCFHPNVGGQARLACVAWSADPDGSGDASSCF